MNYDAVEILDCNVEPHLDIEKDIEKQKNGLLTFILRLDNGRIVDYNVVEYADFKKYFRLKNIIVTELTLTLNPQLGNQGTTVRTDDSQYST
jgi:hypothetical protein